MQRKEILIGMLSLLEERKGSFFQNTLADILQECLNNGLDPRGLSPWKKWHDYLDFCNMPK